MKWGISISSLDFYGFLNLIPFLDIGLSRRCDEASAWSAAFEADHFTRKSASRDLD